MHIKKLLLKALFLLPCAVWSMGAMAQDGKQYLALKINGEAVFIALADNPVITYSGDALHISTDEGETIDVEVEDVNRGLFTTTEEIPTSLSQLIADKPTMKGGLLLLDRLKADSTVQLLTTDGKVAFQTKANADGQAAVNLSDFPKGAYLLKTATQTIKLLNIEH